MTVLINLLGSIGCVRPISTSLIGEFDCKFISQTVPEKATEPFKITLSCDTSAAAEDVAHHLNAVFHQQLKASAANSAFSGNQVNAYCGAASHGIG